MRSNTMLTLAVLLAGCDEPLIDVRPDVDVALLEAIYVVRRYPETEVMELCDHVGWDRCDWYPGGEVLGCEIHSDADMTTCLDFKPRFCPDDGLLCAHTPAGFDVCLCTEGE